MTTYYTYDQDEKRLTAADRVIRRDGQTIILGNAADFARYLNAHPLAATQPTPTPPEGKVAVPDGYGLVNGEWSRTYVYEDAPPPPPRTFSKLKIVGALVQAGVWPQVKEFLEQSGLYDLYLAAQDFAEDNEYFLQGKQALQQLIGWTDEQVEELLAASVIG